MPTGDVMPLGRRRAWCHSQASGTFSGHPVVTSSVAETTCQSQAIPSATGTADCKLQQQPIIQLSKLGGEKLQSISPKDSARQPRTSTPIESVSLQPPETESMEVDTPVVQATSQNSRVSTVTPSATQGVRTLQARPQLTGPRSWSDLKTKQHAITQQHVTMCNTVAGILESRSIESGGLGV